MTVTPAEQLAGYEAALESTVYLAQENAHYVRIEGADRVDFLHRQTTNDMHLLGPERAVLTVLTSPTARVYDVLLLVDDGEAIGAVTLPGRGPDTAIYFQSRIFFNDKVTVVDASSDWAQFALEGPEAGSVLVRLGMAEAPDVDQVATLGVESTEIRVVGREGVAGNGYLMLVPAEAKGAVQAALDEAGVMPMSPDAYAVLRVEAGLPGEHELSEHYTPLEANLRRAISETKGCYTGQEIIARQITYDKVTKGLAGLRLEGVVEVGSDVMAEGKRAGTVTSAVQSPRLGPIALAVVKRSHDEAGTLVVVANGDVEVAGEVAMLPFNE